MGLKLKAAVTIKRRDVVVTQAHRVITTRGAVTVLIFFVVIGAYCLNRHNQLGIGEPLRAPPRLDHGLNRLLFVVAAIGQHPVKKERRNQEQERDHGNQQDVDPQISAPIGAFTCFRRAYRLRRQAAWSHWAIKARSVWSLGACRSLRALRTKSHRSLQARSHRPLQARPHWALGARPHRPLRHAGARWTSKLMIKSLWPVGVI